MFKLYVYNSKSIKINISSEIDKRDMESWLSKSQLYFNLNYMHDVPMYNISISDEINKMGR